MPSHTRIIEIKAHLYCALHTFSTTTGQPLSSNDSICTRYLNTSSNSIFLPWATGKYKTDFGHIMLHVAVYLTLIPWQTSWCTSAWCLEPPTEQTCCIIHIMGGGRCLPPKSEWCHRHGVSQSATTCWYGLSPTLHTLLLGRQPTSMFLGSIFDIQLVPEPPEAELPLVLN